MDKMEIQNYVDVLKYIDSLPEYETISEESLLEILTKRGFDTKRFFALEEYYNKDRPSYYSALSSADEGGRDLTEWLEYFLFGIAVEISRVEKTVLKLSSDRSRFDTAFGHYFSED